MQSMSAFKDLYLTQMSSSQQFISAVTSGALVMAMALSNILDEL